MEGHRGARVAPPGRIYPKRFVGMTAHVIIIYTDTRSYWDGFVYGQWRPAFDLGDLRHDNGSAGRRADKMQSRRTTKWGIRQVTRCYTYPGGEILEALRERTNMHVMKWIAVRTRVLSGLASWGRTLCDHQYMY